MSIFGPLVSRWQLEQAVLDTLRLEPAGGSAPRLIYYLAEVERQTGLTPHTLKTPPGPNSYRGGVDFNTVEAEWMPQITANCKPTSTAEALDRYTWGQQYEIQVAAMCGDDDEDQARMIADSYSIAIAGAIGQYGSLGGIATDTIPSRMPAAELISPTVRQVVRSIVIFQTLIAVQVTTGGPSIWPADPYDDPGNFPVVETVNVTVDVQPNNG